MSEPIHQCIRVDHVEWEGGSDDGRRRAKIVASTSEVEVVVRMDAAHARLLARDLLCAADWCDEVLA